MILGAWLEKILFSGFLSKTLADPVLERLRH